MLIRREEIRVGHMLKLKKNERAPVDGILIATSNQLGYSFVQTDQLDGETDWKIREAVETTQKLLVIGEHRLFSSKWSVIADEPKQSFNEFSGFLINEFGHEEEKIANKNLILGGVKIATDEVIILTVYAGRETKIELSQTETSHKTGAYDQQINSYVGKYFLLTIVLTIVFSVIKTRNILSYSFFQILLGYFFNFACSIPIMMKTNLILGRIMVFIRRIQNDPDIPETIVRNLNNMEDLGQIEILLTDKTGTLTRNEMTLKHLRSPVGFYDSDNFNELKQQIIRFNEHSEPLKIDFMREKKNAPLMKNEQMLKDLCDNILLCHNVIPIEEDGKRILQSSSPDELGLIKFVESLGYKIESRSLSSISISTPLGTITDFLIKEIFPFDNVRKRMGVLIKNLTTGDLTFYAKGSDSTMKNFFTHEDMMFVEEQTASLANLGFRTLVYGKSNITEEDYLKWKTEMTARSKNAQSKAIAEREFVDHFEHSMTMLGVSGIEDLLQHDVKITIQNLREANISTWMVTGDKLETALCISQLAGLRRPNYGVKHIDSTHPSQITEFFKSFDYTCNSLLITGECLDVILPQEELKKLFFDVAVKTENINFCRCTPNQKALIATILREDYKKIVCAIGDGGNDVGMIQKATVGVGIMGKESMQASLSADISVKDFKALQHLIIWHGRNMVVCLNRVSSYTIYRKLMYISIHFMMLAYVNFLPMSFFKGFFAASFFTYYSNSVCITFGLEETLPKEQVLQYARIYRLTQKYTVFNPLVITSMSFKSIFQCAVCFIGIFVLFPNSDFEFLAANWYFVIIFIFFLDGITETQRMYHVTLLMSSIIWISMALHISSLKDTTFNRTHFGMNLVLNWAFIAFVAWVPYQLVVWAKKYCYPDSLQKIIKETDLLEERRKNTQLLKLVF